MREKKFDFVIYPLDLIITVGLDYKTLCDRFENMEPEHEGKWGDEDEVIIYQFTPVHFDASQPQPTPATPRPLPGSPPVTYLIGLEDSVFLTQISLCS